MLGQSWLLHTPVSGLPKPDVCVSAFLSPCRCQVSSFLCIRRQVCQHDFLWFLTGHRQAIHVAIQAVILKQLKSPFPVRAAIFNSFHGELPSKSHDVYRIVYRHSWLRKHSGHHRKLGCGATLVSVGRPGAAYLTYYTKDTSFLCGLWRVIVCQEEKGN